jgi:hypothetical protein
LLIWFWKKKRWRIKVVSLSLRKKRVLVGAVRNVASG